MTRAERLLVGLAALSGLMAIAAGAFGAHGASDPVVRGWLQTGGHYQLVHALAALAAVLLARQGLPLARASAWLFLAGGLVFSGGLYLLALGAPRILGAATPVGGLLMLAGWAQLAVAAFARPRNNPA